MTLDDVQAQLAELRGHRRRPGPQGNRTMELGKVAPATIEAPRPPSPIERPPPVLQAFMRWRDAYEDHHWTEARAALAELDRWKESPYEPQD